MTDLRASPLAALLSLALAHGCVFVLLRAGSTNMADFALWQTLIVSLALVVIHAASFRTPRPHLIACTPRTAPRVSRDRGASSR